RKGLIKLMVGRELIDQYPTKVGIQGEKVLEVKHITNKYVKDVSLTLHRGEILGLGGLVGAGRTEVARAIFGADDLLQGEVILNGRKVNIKSPKDAISYGIGLIPEDRKHHGVLLGLSIGKNVTLSSLKRVSKWGVINKVKEKSIWKDLKESLKIKAPSLDQYVKNLSGGNQQKVVLAKWLATQCDILIFDEPTRGIDIGAKQEIYKLMHELVEKGKSIIMISSEMPELLGMSDRILVMHEGKLVGEVSREEATQEVILDMAAH
ncbi:MAG: sugar ABC transporter ATP-binding protein, partial [Vallitaleaceae bacterium]|nr:sugar ABC transporter ATP-binding protein [Vallitaleaceae bacterium]